MRKVRVLIAALAVVLAAGSAFSTVESRRSVIYYQSTSPGASCVTEFHQGVCAEGSNAQCEIDRPNPNPDLYISKMEDGGQCEELKRL